MIASLGMYDMPAMRDANDRYWQAIRAELDLGPDLVLPENLTRSDDLWSIWQDPELLFAQTCGYPYRDRLYGHVELVGTPDHGLSDCPPGHYRSVLVVRADDDRQSLEDFNQAPLAYNDPLSQSGWAAPVAHLLDRDVRPGALVLTGAHAASAEAVCDHRADLAGIDAVTWELLCTHAPELTGDLRVLDLTAPTPALPYITAQGGDVPVLFAAVSRAIAGLDPEVRAALHLHGLVAIPATEYLAIRTPPAPDDL